MLSIHHLLVLFCNCLLISNIKLFIFASKGSPPPIKKRVKHNKFDASSCDCINKKCSLCFSLQGKFIFFISHEFSRFFHLFELNFSTSFKVRSNFASCYFAKLCFNKLLDAAKLSTAKFCKTHSLNFILAEIRKCNTHR